MSANSVGVSPTTVLGALGMQGLQYLTSKPVKGGGPATAASTTATAPSVSATGSPDKTLQLLLAAGLVGGGAYGMGRLMSGKKDKTTDEKNLEKLSHDIRQMAVTRVDAVLTKLARDLPAKDEAAVRLMQGCLAYGASIKLAAKTAFPRMEPIVRDAFTRELVKQAICAKTVEPKSGLSKQLDVKMFDTNETKTASLLLSRKTASVEDAAMVGSAMAAPLSALGLGAAGAYVGRGFDRDAARRFAGQDLERRMANLKQRHHQQISQWASNGRSPEAWNWATNQAKQKQNVFARQLQKQYLNRVQNPGSLWTRRLGTVGGVGGLALGLGLPFLASNMFGR